MYNHAPIDYTCPFCLLLRGIENEYVDSMATDIFYSGKDVSAFISSRQWPNNHGHALVTPNHHYENIYDLPTELGGKFHRVVQDIAMGMKALYGCDGISTRQHNEPAGNQDVWHYHVHVFPRYAGDQLYTSQYSEMAAKQRARFLDQLKSYFQEITNGP